MFLQELRRNYDQSHRRVHRRSPEPKRPGSLRIQTRPLPYPSKQREETIRRGQDPPPNPPTISRDIVIEPGFAPQRKSPGQNRLAHCPQLPHIHPDWASSHFEARGRTSTGRVLGWRLLWASGHDRWESSQVCLFLDGQTRCCGSHHSSFRTPLSRIPQIRSLAESLRETSSSISSSLSSWRRLRASGANLVTST